MDTAQLKQELRTPIDSLSEAYRLAYSTLELLDYDYISEEKAHSRAYAEYKFFTADVRTEGPFGTDSEEVISRPVNDDVFIQDTETFADKYDEFESLLHDFDVDEIAQPTRQLTRTVTYSLTISIGITMDFLVDQQGSRKNFGERFDDTIISIFEELAVVNSSRSVRTSSILLSVPTGRYGRARTASIPMRSSSSRLRPLRRTVSRTSIATSPVWKRPSVARSTGSRSFCTTFSARAGRARTMALRRRSCPVGSRTSKATIRSTGSTI